MVETLCATVSISSGPHNADHTLQRRVFPLESLPPPQQLLHFSRKDMTRTHKHIATQQTHNPPTQCNTNEATPSPIFQEYAEVLASSFSAPQMSM